jgi:hypothetical protein
MQAYVRTKPDLSAQQFNDRQRRRRGSQAPADQVAVPSEGAPPVGAWMALAALLLDGLDEDALRSLAKRLAPHLSRLKDPNQPAHIAYTVDSLAAELGVSPKAIRCAIGRGELHAVKRGSRWIISSGAVAEWATAIEPRRARPHGGRGWAPKAAGPSLRSVLCDGGAG